MDKVIGGFANPGLAFCEGIARAFRVPLEDVFRVAGILPMRSGVREARLVYDLDNETRLLQLYRELPEDERGLVMELVERLSGRVVARIVGAADESG